MHQAWKRAAALAAGLALACPGSEKQRTAADDELTIVVQADRTRLAGEEAALQEQRRVLEQERTRLNAELERVAQQKESSPESSEAVRLALEAVKKQEAIEALLKRQEAIAKERDDLLKKVTESPVPVAPAPAPAATVSPAFTSELQKVIKDASERDKAAAGRERSVAEREKDLAEREKALAAREASLAEREASCQAGGGRARGPELTAGQVARAYKDLLGAMDRKGILPDDLPASRQKAFKAASSQRSKDPARAMDGIESVQTAVDNLVIDDDFIQAKSKRINQLAAGKKATGEIAELLRQASRSATDGRYQEANRALNNIVSIIGSAD